MTKNPRPSKSHAAPLPAREVKAAMTDAQREIHVKQALTRFIRNRSLPDEIEDLRYRLIQARVMQGMLAVEAAEKFGYANSAQLSKMESGQSTTPRDWAFLKKAAEVYSVSVDWLLGLVKDMEPDCRIAHQYALLRGVDGIVDSLKAQLATVMIHSAVEIQPVVSDLDEMIGAVDEATAWISTVANTEEFQDVPKGGKYAAIVRHLADAIAPLRIKRKRIKGIESYMAEVKEGTLPAIPYLVDRYAQTELELTQ